jgi:hypothetical protein
MSEEIGVVSDHQSQATETGFDPRGLRLQHVLKLLDAEISEATSEQTRHGWTTRAVLAALAGCLWLGAGILESGVARPSNYLILFLFFSLVVDCLHVLTSLLFWQPIRAYSTDRFRWPSFIGNRLVMLILVLRAVALISIAVVYRGSIGWPYIVATVFYGVIGCFWMMYLVFDLLRIPLQITPGVFSIKIALAGLTFAFLGGTSLLGSYFALFARPQSLTASDFRLGGLLVVAVILLWRFAWSVGGSPLVSTLVEVRRGLLLGQTDLDTAVHQTEIAFMGMRVADVLQAEIQAYLFLYNQIEQECMFIDSEIDALETSLRTEGHPMSEKASMLATTVFRSTVDHYVRIQQRIHESFTMNKKLARRLKRIPRGSEKVQKDIDRLVSALTTEEKRIAARVSHIETLIESLKGRIAQ